MTKTDKKLRICIDLDGTICEIKNTNQTYSDVAVKAGARERIKQLSDAGHTIIIHTARNMNTSNHNVGKAVKNIGKVTLEWLDRNQIIYDEIFFGKPNADITIDDRTVRFEDNWEDMTEEVLIHLAKDK